MGKVGDGAADSLHGLADSAEVLTKIIRALLFCFLPLKGNQNMLSAWCGRKLRGPFLSGWSEAQLSCFLT
jgi:hypothetical protein